MGADMTEAKLNREYAVRILGVGALMAGMCVWSLYDGRVAWPRQNRHMEAVRPSLLVTNLTAEAWLARDEDRGSPLENAFSARGFKVPSKLVKRLGELRVPGTAADRGAVRAAQAERVRKVLEIPVYSAHDLQTQFVQAAVTLALGLCAFLAVGLKARRRYFADDEGLGGSGLGGQRVPYAAISRIEWAKWDEKGIVTLTLSSGARHTLDGWHFAGMTGIVNEILKHRPELNPTKK